MSASAKHAAVTVSGEDNAMIEIMYLGYHKPNLYRIISIIIAIGP